MTGNLFSQNFKGTVIDSKKLKPLPDCLIIIKGSTTSAVTDDHGNFSISFSKPNKDVTLVITMLGYTTIEYDLKTYQKDTFYITPKEFQLKTVEIVSEKKAILNPKSQDVILDFDVLNDDIVLLIAGQDRNDLKLISTEGKQLSKMKVNKHSELLKHDCIGNLQLLSNDSTWQIFYDFEKLNSLNPYSFQSYEKIMSNCVCSNDHNFYFQNMYYRNLRTNYFYFSEKEKGIKRDLISFGDTAKIRSFELDYNLQYFLKVRRESNYTMYNEPVDSIMRKMERYREVLPLDPAYNSWLGKIETEMVKKDSDLFIVNFTDSIIYHVNKNNNVKPLTKLYVAGYKDLIHKVYTDADHNENYIIQYRNNQLILIRFDLNSGKELSKTTIPNVPYLPRKIIIQSGKVYFIQKNLADQQVYKLVKCSLNS